MIHARFLYNNLQTKLTKYELANVWLICKLTKQFGIIFFNKFRKLSLLKGEIMLAQEKQDNLDYIYIEKLKTKNERQLKTMLATLERETTKIQIEKAKLESTLKDEIEKLENKLKDKIKKEHFIKDALMEKWRTPSAELLEAIEEVKRGETTSYNSVDEMMKDLEQ